MVLRMGQRDQLIEPAVGHDHVVIEQHQVFPAGKVQPLVDGGREAPVGGIAHDGDRHAGKVADAGQVHAGPVGRPVIDGDQLPRRPRVVLEGGDALPGELELVPGRDDDRRQAADRAGIHGGISPRGQGRERPRLR